MNEQPKKSLFRRFWWLIIILAVLLAGFVLITNKNPRDDKSENLGKTITEDAQNVKKDNDIKFTHQIFDPEKVSHITPLGELNGGYEEAQTINGVMVNIKKDAGGNADPIEVYAPADMTLEDYSYFPDGNSPAQWHLGFRISEDMKMSFDHLSSVPDEIKAVTPQTASSAYVPPTKRLSFKAGELIATTSGTEQAHNWNIYLRDDRKVNTFVNQERYEKVKQGYSFLNAACPFDYYGDFEKSLYLALMGYSKAGESKTCGTNSKDAKGSVSGLWHLSKEGVQAEYQGQYATPFSIYLASSNEIIIYEIGKKRYILGDKNSTYKDPTSVTDSHCYNLTEYGDSRSTQGYAYFKIVSDTEMKINFNSSGSCPSSFPETNAKTYYR